MSGALVSLLALHEIGRWVWRWRAPSMLHALLAGAPLFSLAVFALLVTGAFRLPLVLPLLLISIGTMLWRCPARPAVREFMGEAAARLRSERWLWFFLAPLLLVGLFLYLPNALAPEYQPDSAGYHLGAVAEWVRTGRLHKRTGFYEVMPFGFETLFATAFLIGKHSAAKLVHFSFFVLTIPLLLRTAQRLEVDRRAAWVGVSLYWLAPVCGIAGTCAYNDAGLLFFQVGVLLLLLEWWECRDARWLWVAGLAAGFGATIKLNGLLWVALGAVALLLMKQWRGALRFSAAAAVVIAPWMQIAWKRAHNPVAPLFNRWFPDSIFHPWLDQDLAHLLRHYTLTSYADLPRALLWDGVQLQGLIGFTFALTPLALLALRQRAGRKVWGVILLFLIPYTQNIGARFLMPVLPFVGMALAMVELRVLAPALVLLQAISALPPVMHAYASPWAWRLTDAPWRGALRLEDEGEFLRSRSHDYLYAEMVNRHVGGGQTLLDLHSLPSSYLPQLPIGPMPSVQTDQIRDALVTGLSDAPPHSDRVVFTWPKASYTAIRLRLEGPLQVPWTVRELELCDEDGPVDVSRDWSIRAWPLAVDAPLAVDRNLATRWHTGAAAPAGSFIEIDFHRPVALTALRGFIAFYFNTKMRVRLYGRTAQGTWELIPATVTGGPVKPGTFRRGIHTFLQMQGIQWMVIHAGVSPVEAVGRAMVAGPEAWGLEKVDSLDTLYLFRVK